MDKYNLTKLSNGLRLLTIPMPSVQSVTVMVMVNTGSRNETKEINGLSHFLEHMAFKGTNKRPNSLLISSEIEGVGGDFNAYTSKHTIAYHVKLAVVHFELAVDILSDILQNSKLGEKEIEREKGVIIEEINMYEDLPMRRVQELFEQLLYKGSALGFDIAGNRETVTGLKRQDFVDYLDKYYFPANMVVVVAGGVAEVPAKKLITKYFNNNQKVGQLTKPNDKFIQTKPELLIKPKKTDQAHLVIGVRGHAMGHPDRYTESILDTILGGGMSSRLFIAIRERRGLAYYVRTESDHFIDNGYLATRAGVDLKRLDEAIKVILEEYHKIASPKHGITVKELTKAKECIKGSLILEMENSREVAGFYGFQELLEEKIRTPKEIFKGIDKVTVEDVNRVAKEFFVPERLNLTLISPFEDKERFEKLLMV
ncbi:hypothetical protein COT44_03725 [Candidatus Shapirobacteria bacterium CG08_land_8_20_14_0_20_39_18]|uniref:Peptidase M16 n=1 Tax=Candidatus Shapirobacteria bacterium CG08_land_8_20_14_0_20_39_18 TaxID=1974883 RepID=A0A2M6XCE7_9BACT|nr:MAG: hypothetical protein COT44_03725 [Candidatus Shapirobacteria bacterium CG08_land_8_20_14_0_20_39_18]PIY64745.1 MAG: hypothetical protein COY91_04400 [Candidatus Shapirobacteria bacterium CG_4_10_14_0_8_um_filter_39_15]